MKEVSEYKLLCGPSDKALNQLVNKHIKEGWVLYEAPFIGRQGSINYFAQAVVKQKE